MSDVPSTIGWGAVALFLRHLPYDSELMRETNPRTAWNAETHMLANILNMIGDLFAQDYEPIQRPGEIAKYSTAEPVDSAGYERKLSAFRKGDDGG